MDAYPELSFIGALQSCVAALHQKVFDNLVNWASHVGLPSRVKPLTLPSGLTFGEPFGNVNGISLGSYDLSIWEFQCSEEPHA